MSRKGREEEGVKKRGEGVKKKMGKNREKKIKIFRRGERRSGKREKVYLDPSTFEGRKESKYLCMVQFFTTLLFCNPQQYSTAGGGQTE